MATLKNGSKGDAVKKLQSTLLQLGYAVTVNGIFANDTLQAVIRFQKDNGLSPDGVVGVNTQAVLDYLSGTNPVTGIDISHHNGTINWNLVNKKNVEFVFCKASQGKAYKDDMLQTNMSELARLDFNRGAYHFFSFMGVTAQEQVDNFLSCGIDFKVKGVLPPVIDVEWQATKAINDYIVQNRKACAQKIQDWLDGVEKATKRKPIIYAAKGFWNDILGNPPGFEQYPLWVASYRNDRPTMPGNWTNYQIWQYTESGQVEGIVGKVDKNLFNGSRQQLKKLATP